MKKVCIVIPMFNFNEMTEKCVNLARKNAGMDDVDILVVDNGSAKEYAAQDGELVINLSTNTGFTNAVNEGIKWCSHYYKYIMLLNNDTEPYPGYLKALVDVMDSDNKIAVASSVRKVPMNGEGSYELGGMDWMRGHSKLAWQKEHDVMDFEWVPFCSVILRYDIIRELGLLDKNMKNYCSDNDFCARARMAGYRVVVVPQSEVLHYRGVTVIENKDNLDLGMDQKLFLEKLSGLTWQTLLDKMPLDVERNIWGRINFDTENR